MTDGTLGFEISESIYRKRGYEPSLEALPWAELDRAAWRRIGEVGRDLRASGASVPLTDLAIAVAAVSAGASVWTRDEDFERIRSALPELDLVSP